MSERTPEQKRLHNESARKSTLKKKAEHQVLEGKVGDLEAQLAKLNDYGPNSTIYRHDPNLGYPEMADDYCTIRKYMQDNVGSLSTISGIFF
jgi:hypothetical protein